MNVKLWKTAVLADLVGHQVAASTFCQSWVCSAEAVELGEGVAGLPGLVLNSRSSCLHSQMLGSQAGITISDLFSGFVSQRQAGGSCFWSATGREPHCCEPGGM